MSPGRNALELNPAQSSHDSEFGFFVSRVEDEANCL